MEPLRWILLAAGIAFVLVIYLLGRSRRRRKHSMVDALEDDPDALQNELPEFSAGNLDNIDEGVGAVKVITGAGPNAIEDDFSGFKVSAKDGDDAEPLENGSVSDSTGNDGIEGAMETDAADSPRTPSDIIVLFILPKPDKLLQGSQINSSAQAMGLTFGDMNIFHYSPAGRNIFSLANMLEPGSFDADTIHDVKTSGLTVFMQLAQGDPLDDLTEMLQRSYQLAGLLDARLCNHKRQPLTEQDAENYRGQVRDFIQDKKPELSSET